MRRGQAGCIWPGSRGEGANYGPFFRLARPCSSVITESQGRRVRQARTRKGAGAAARGLSRRRPACIDSELEAGRRGWFWLARGAKYSDAVHVDVPFRLFEFDRVVRLLLPVPAGRVNLPT